MKPNSINIYTPTDPIQPTNTCIIAIENGVVVAKYPNKPNYRMQASSEGFDVLTVTEEVADELWKKTVSLQATVIDLTFENIS